jgi:serine/threonine-protein kinase
VPASALGAGVAPATIVVSSTPSGSGVFVNGELHGTTPLAVVLPGGAHQVEVRTVDGRTEHFSLEADSGARVTRHVDFGTVAVLATPPAEPTAVPRERPRPATAPVAQVVVDVRAAPAATPTPLPRPAPARRPVTGSLNVNALPWAEILIDGRAFGETPLANIVLPVGTHEILFRHPQLGEQTRTVVIGPEGPTRVSVDLRR